MALTTTTTTTLTPPDLRRMDRRAQAGFTLVELLVALVIGGLIIGSAALALNFSVRQDDSSRTSLQASNSAFRTGTRFADDVASVSAVPGVTDLITAGTTGCGNSTSVLRLVGAGPGGTVLVRSYHRAVAGTGTQLVRRECSGASLAAALGGVAAANVVVDDLDPASSSTAVDCDGAAVSSNCRVVTMTVRTAGSSVATGRTFQVRGSIDSALQPTPTTTPALVVAPVTGTCTIPASATAWGATGGAAGSSSDVHNGDGNLYTYNDTNQRRSFLKFDLTQPCAGPSDSWPTLPGGRNITSATLYIAYLGKYDPSCCGAGISKDGQVLEVLNDSSTWSEATLNGSNMPGGVRSGSYGFNVATQGALTAHTDTTTILTAVKNWYAPGGWVNNGWRLSRSGAGDTLGKVNVFASRFNATTNLRPKLVITWGP